MNAKHYVIVFAIVLLTSFVLITNKINSLATMNAQASNYNETIDNAVDDSLHSMLETTDSFKHVTNLTVCSETFFKALFAGFGVTDSKTGMGQLQMYVPALLLTDTDGFYVMYHSVSNDGLMTAREWSAKQPYCRSGTLTINNGTPTTLTYQISFTMTDVIKVQLTVGDESYYFEGHYKTIEEECKDDDGIEYLKSFVSQVRAHGQFLSPEKFDKFRQSVMIYQVTKKMNYYVNRHNSIAEAYGISYNFELPESSMDNFSRSIEDISLLAIFQGYPYGVGSTDVYSRFSLSGARLYKSTRYYVVEKDGIRYYHRANCKDIQTFLKSGAPQEIYDTKRECASRGAYPCPHCKP